MALPRFSLSPRTSRVWFWSAAGIATFAALALSGWYLYQQLPALSGSNPAEFGRSWLPGLSNRSRVDSGEGTDETIPAPSDTQLVIDKLGIAAPITWDTDAYRERIYLAVLGNGIGHFRGTSHPGEGGNIFLFAHSGYTQALKNDYHRLFRRLDQLAPGDPVVIQSPRETVTYRVIDEKIVAPDDFSVIEPTPKEIITLMTCWPPGKTDQRYIVRAERM